MAAKWVPRTEKSFLIGIISAGGQLGPVTGMLLSGSLTSAFGWEVVFYCLGSAIVVWFACFVFLVYSTPSDHPRISQVETIKSQFGQKNSKIQNTSVFIHLFVMFFCSSCECLLGQPEEFPKSSSLKPSA